METRIIHRAQLFFFPGSGKHEIRCLDCDEVIVPNPLHPDTVFYIPGECEPRDKLRIATSDSIGVTDTVR